VVLASNRYRRGCARLNTNHPTSFSVEYQIPNLPLLVGFAELYMVEKMKIPPSI